MWQRRRQVQQTRAVSRAVNAVLPVNNKLALNHRLIVQCVSILVVHSQSVFLLHHCSDCLDLSVMYD